MSKFFETTVEDMQKAVKGVMEEHEELEACVVVPLWNVYSEELPAGVLVTKDKPTTDLVLSSVMAASSCATNILSNLIKAFQDIQENNEPRDKEG